MSANTLTPGEMGTLLRNLSDAMRGSLDHMDRLNVPQVSTIAGLTASAVAPALARALDQDTVEAILSLITILGTGVSLAEARQELFENVVPSLMTRDIWNSEIAVVINEAEARIESVLKS